MTDVSATSVRWKSSLPENPSVRYRRDKVLVICSSGDGLSIANAMQQEGTPIYSYIHSPEFSQVYDGILPKVTRGELIRTLRTTRLVLFMITRKNWQTNADIKLLEMFGCPTDSMGVFGPVADKIAQDIPVVGCSQWTEELELDRVLGSKIAKQLGMEIPETHEFNGPNKAKNIAAGIDFLEAHDDVCWVFKPNGNEGLDLTYVESKPRELLAKLRGDIPDRLSSKDGAFILQKKVKGIEISTEFWNTGGYVGKGPTLWNHTLEEKKLMVDSLGPNIGSAQNLVWRKLNLRDGYLVKEMTKLVPMLGAYKGPSDWNTIISEEDRLPYHLEPTVRNGYDASNGLLALRRPGQRITDFYFNNFELEWQPGYAATERVSIPPYPEDNKESLKKAKDVVVHNEPDDSLWLDDVYRDENGELRCAATNAVIGIVTGVGLTPDVAIDLVYWKIKQLDVGSDLQYRTDLKDRVKRDLLRLDEFGIIVD